METLTIFIPPGILWLLTLAFGFWVRVSGKPYNPLLFNVHKLLALAAVITTAVQLNNILKIIEPQPLVLVLIFLAALGVVALFFSGAMMSTGQLSYAGMRALHRLALAGTLLVMGMTIYFIFPPVF